VIRERKLAGDCNDHTVLGIFWGWFRYNVVTDLADFLDYTASNARLGIAFDEQD